MTKIYKVKISQIIDIELDNTSKNKTDRKLINEILKSDPPFSEVISVGEDCWNNMKTSDRIKIMKIKKIGEYKICSKCKGTGDSGNYNGLEDCYRCGGRGEVLKRRKKK